MRASEARRRRPRRARAGAGAAGQAYASSGPNGPWHLAAQLDASQTPHSEPQSILDFEFCRWQCPDCSQFTIWGSCSVTDEFQLTHLRLTRLVNSELTAACMHAAVTAGCDDLQNGRGSQYCGARILAPSGNACLLVLDPDSAMGTRIVASSQPEAETGGDANAQMTIDLRGLSLSAFWICAF